ncbi:endonuclease/exonuclease/phosphatase family protein [Microbispora corallina]|uniref:endonuclease/exonuclease/phosphatase family protein n=1 Tax=Microbispora corallina TaxID=83302 RepID=UPI00194F5D3B|nr:endonuclease/exonuclease/phosphatase family protein [Microbispora corallina]
MPGRRRPLRRIAGVLAWLAAVPLAGLALLRILGVESSTLPVGLVALTPFAAGAAVVTALLGVASRGRAATAVTVVLALLFAWWVVPRAVGGRQEAGGHPLRVLTANLNEGRADPQAIVDLIRRLHPDVVTLEELTPWLLDDLDAGGLSALLPYRVAQTGPGPTGTGIFSARPLTERTGLFTPVGHHMPVAETTTPDGTPVEIVAVHPVAPVPETVGEWEEGVRTLPPAPSSGVTRILSGDFNSTLDHAVLRNLLATGYVDSAAETGNGLTMTWPAGHRLFPMVAIDHVLVDKRSFAVSTAIEDLPRSDHRGVFAELRIAP